MSGKKSEWSYIGPRRSFKAIVDKPSSIKEWKVRFFIAEGNIGSDFPTKWGNFVRDTEAHVKLSEQEEEDVGVLCDGRVFSANSLLSEEALFAAGLSPIDPQAKKSALAGRIGKELGKRPREAGEKRKSEKKARLSKGGIKIDLRSSLPKTGEAGASAAGEESSPSVFEQRAEEQRAEEDQGRTAEIPCPLVVEIEDSSDEAPTTRPAAPPLGDETLSGPAEAGTSAVAPSSEEVPPAQVGEIKGAMVLAEVQGEPTVRELSLEGPGGDVGPSMAVGELPPTEVREAERIEASLETVGEEQAMEVEEGSLDGEEEQEEGPSTDALSRLAPGLAELSEEAQARVLLKEARRLKASRLDAAQAGPSGMQPDASDPATEAAFSALMKSALCPSESLSMDELADLDLIDAAFGQRDVAKDVHLLPDIDNSTLMRMARSYNFRSALTTRALCWRLNLATGAGIQAKRVSAELRLRAEASERFERVLDMANKNLAQAKMSYQGVLEEASKLKLEVEELRGLRTKYEEVCSDLSKIKSEHAGEMEAVNKRFSESWNKLRRDAAEEKARLNRMLDETEGKIRHLQHCVAASEERAKWDQEKINQLDSELNQSREEANNKQLRINDLKNRIDQVKADKLRAFSEVEGLTEKIARLEKEV